MEELKEMVLENAKAILPIAALVVVLQLVFLQQPGPEVLQFLIGVVLVSLGLGLFLLGIKIGLLPLGEMIGSELTQRGSMTLLLIFTFFFGIAVTVAEPNVRVLSNQINAVSDVEIAKNTLVGFVALGVGISMSVAAARVVLGVPMSYILIGGYAAIFALSAFVPPHFIPISFDSGGITTGPLAVPVLIALGVGLTSALGGKSSLSDSFGFVALAYIGPILAVMLLGVIYA